MNAIFAENLTKSYGGAINALENLSLEVEEGRVFGFLGPNGAGKTTTVKLLTGLLTPTAGECAVLGEVSTARAGGGTPCLWRHDGDSPAFTAIYPALKILFLRYFVRHEKHEATERGNELLKSWGFFARDKKAGAYSTGMLQRLSLARALVARPRVIF